MNQAANQTNYGQIKVVNFILWLQDNGKEMHSSHNERKYVVTERFTRTLKNKIYKYLTSVSKNVYIDKLADVD